MKDVKPFGINGDFPKDGNCKKPQEKGGIEAEVRSLLDLIAKQQKSINDAVIQHEIDKLMLAIKMKQYK